MSMDFFHFFEKKHDPGVMLLKGVTCHKSSTFVTPCRKRSPSKICLYFHMNDIIIIAIGCPSLFTFWSNRLYKYLPNIYLFHIVITCWKMVSQLIFRLWHDTCDTSRPMTPGSCFFQKMKICSKLTFREKMYLWEFHKFIEIHLLSWNMSVSEQ